MALHRELSIHTLTNSQKVAALLIAMGPKIASEVLKNIDNDNEVEHLALEIASLNKIEPELLAAILAEFYAFFQASGYIASGGVNYARQVLMEAYGDSQADKILERLVTTLQSNPFDFFNMADPSQMATSFQNENPQLVALVLAYLRPEQAAAIMVGLPPEMQAEVAKRIADMDRTNPEVLREVERIMESKFSSVVTNDFSSAGGVESLAEIINRTDRATEKAILDSLELRDPETAEQVRELMFVFEDIVKLDDRAIQRVLREVDSKDLGLSLKGASDTIRNKILKNMSERAGAMLLDEMEYLGAVRAKDVQERQTFIVGIIRALEATGEIQLARGAEKEEFIK